MTLIKRIAIHTILFICCYFTSIFTAFSADIKETKKYSVELPIDARFDFSYHDHTGANDSTFNEYLFHYTDFNIQANGQINRNIGFNFMYRFKGGTTTAENIASNVMAANVYYKSNNDHWKLTAGKFFIKIASAEQDYWRNDVYTYSLINNNLSVFRTGVSVEYSTDNQQAFGIHVLNATESTNPGLEYHAYWFGNLFDKKVQPKASYTFLNKYGDLGNSHVYNVGIFWYLGQWQVDTDFAYAKNRTYLYKKSGVYSMPIKVHYQGKNFRPFVKYIYNGVNFDEATTSCKNPDELINFATVHTIEGGIEYYPFESKDFRLHMVGTKTVNNDCINLESTNDLDSNNHATENFRLMAGVCIGFDLLKGW